MARGGPGARADDEGEKSEDEGKACHHYRAESQTRRRDGGVVDAFPQRPLLDRKGDDQNAVLGGERNQCDQADLRVDVETQPGQRDRDERAEYGDADRHQGRNRDIPALIKRDQKQIGEQNGKPEDNGRVPACRHLLERGPGPFEAVARRQRRRRHALHRSERLPGTVTGFGRAVDDCGTVAVIAHHGLRALHQLGYRQCAHRNHAAFGVTDVDIVDVLCAVAKRRVGLDVDLPGAAENIEVVDVETAERRLKCVENIADLDAEHLRLVAIDVEIDLWRVGSIGAEHAGKLGLLVGRHDQSAKHRRDVGGRLALQSFEDVLKAAGTAQAEDRREVEWKGNGALDCPKLWPQPRDDRVSALRPIGAHLVGFQPDDEESLIRRCDIVDKVQPDHRQHAFDAGDWPDNILDLLDHRLGAGEGRALRKP